MLLHSVSGVLKTSAVLISARGESGFYRSLEEVPEPLRSRLIETTNSPNSGTIVIADRAGKEQISEAIARREAEANRDETSEIVEPATPAIQRRFPHISPLMCIGLLVTAVLVAVAGVLFELHC